MLIQKLKGATLEIWDSSDMPVENYINHSRLVMLDVGIGSDPIAMMQHWTTIKRFADKGDKENLAKALNNYHQSLSFILSNTSPKMMSFVALIHKIDGVVLEDFSDENAAKVVMQLSKKGLTVRIVESVLELVKKKLKLNLKPSKLAAA